MQTLHGKTGAELRTFTTKQFCKHLHHFYENLSMGNVFCFQSNAKPHHSLPFPEQSISVPKISCPTIYCLDPLHWWSLEEKSLWSVESWSKWWDCCHAVTGDMIDDWDDELKKHSDGKLMGTEQKWRFSLWKTFQSQVSKCSSKSSNLLEESFDRARDATGHNATLLHHLYEIWASALVGFAEKTCPQFGWGKLY